MNNFGPYMKTTQLGTRNEHSTHILLEWDAWDKKPQRQMPILILPT
jgi:hypothetical protein